MVSLTLATLSIAGARAARTFAASASHGDDDISTPYTPSMEAAPFVSLGYRELTADLLYIRLRGYFGEFYNARADSVASLAEAIVTLDPSSDERVYWFGATAMTIAREGVDQSIYLRSIALLDRGIARYPNSYQLPMVAAQTYIQDLKTDDPALRRTWDERGALLAESAIRKPGAPIESAGWAATLRTKLGQRDRAIQGLRELLLVSNDARARKGLLERLATLEKTDSAEIAAELLDAREKFDRAWNAERPVLRASMYVLVGAPIRKGFDLVDLATGGRDLVTSADFERLEPLVDEPPPPAPAP